mmetsp:Transcript_5837/g.10508  ORF Transcript_5837/g.10508 Transcript_5837/m.10508 type:complete len:339 (+) Transcript_5837:432-1448(+)
MSDESPPQSQQVGLLEMSWRCESAQRFADWKISVVQTGSRVTTIYPVHRLMLGSGPRKSCYFEALFSSGMAESHQSSSSIELPDEQAALFPLLLDFMYAGKMPKLESPQDAAILFNLYSMGAYFDIPTLREAATNSCVNDLKRSAMTKTVFYLEETESRADTRALFESLIDVCALDIIAMPLNLAKSIKPSWMLAIFEKLSSAIQFICGGELISHCLLSHVASDNLNEATAVELLGFVRYIRLAKDAVRLLTFIDNFEWGGQAKYRFAVRQLCIDIILRDWKILCDENDPEILNLISKLEGKVLFAMTRRAKKEMEDPQRQQGSHEDEDGGRRRRRRL